MALFAADRHERLIDTPWREAAARAALSRIVQDTRAAYCGPVALWPIHPLDVSPERAPVLKPLYYGAAGVIWALRHLYRAGVIDGGPNYTEGVASLLPASRVDARRLHGEPLHGYLLGDAGILLLHWTMAPSAALASELANAIAANANHPSFGLAWGEPGALLAALIMFRRTGDARWRDSFLAGAGRLWSAWAYDPDLRCHLWTQDLYGHVARRLGGLHGFAGVAGVLLQGGDLLPADRRAELTVRIATTLRATAIVAGPHANWPMSAPTGDAAADGEPLLQHCWGAPGMVNCLATLPRDESTDALLLAAGELIWAAGPPVKLPSLCHGAPGSGYAFLKLFQRTGDQRWLDRARRFAMHAAAQADRAAAQFGQRKFSLWTGDLGLAMYLSDCLSGSSALPTVDVF